MLRSMPVSEFGGQSEGGVMDRSRGFPRWGRWSIPAGAVAVVGMVIAGSMIAGAATAPALPARSAAQLLAGIAEVTAPPASLSGVIVETASLGLPQLPDTGSGPPGYSLLAGTHTFRVWYAGPEHVRIAVPVALGETDLRKDGRQVWLWDSGTQTATRIVLPVRPAGPGRFAGPGQGPAGPGAASPRFRVPLTPQQAARQVLAAVGPTTTVSVQRSVMVAGQAAYQLAIAPKDSRSLIGQIRIAVDAHGYLPLRLQVFARGAASPAYQVGFSALSFARPAASNFTFTPPPGARVRNLRTPGRAGGQFLPGNPQTGDSSDNRPALRNQPKAGISFLPAPRAAGAEQALRSAGHPDVRRPGFPMAPMVIGTGWLSVIAVPAQQPGSSLTALPSGSANAGSPGSVTSTRTIAGPAGPGPDVAVLRALLRAAAPVHGSWGSGRLLRTSLLSALFLNNGHVLIGAVTPSVLYADAAKVK
jgi:hypothetical protein